MVYKEYIRNIFLKCACGFNCVLNLYRNWEKNNKFHLRYCCMKSSVSTSLIGQDALNDPPTKNMKFRGEKYFTNYVNY